MRGKKWVWPFSKLQTREEERQEVEAYLGQPGEIARPIQSVGGEYEFDLLDRSYHRRRFTLGKKQED